MIKNNITGELYSSPIEAFNAYCHAHKCDECPFNTGVTICHNYPIEYPEKILDIIDCEEVEPARTPLNGQDTEVNGQDTAVPALCKLFHVLPNEDFYIQNTDGSLFLDAPDTDQYAAPMVFRINEQGLPIQTIRSEGKQEEEEMDGWIIAHVINGNLHIIHKPRVWTDQDIADARAIRRIFPSAWYVERLPHSLNLTVGTLTSSPFEEPPLLKPLVISINPKYFPSVREGETAYITIIKGDNDNAGS